MVQFAKSLIKRCQRNFLDAIFLFKWSINIQIYHSSISKNDVNRTWINIWKCQLMKKIMGASHSYQISSQTPPKIHFAFINCPFLSRNIKNSPMAFKTIRSWQYIDFPKLEGRKPLVWKTFSIHLNLNQKSLFQRYFQLDFFLVWC